MTVNKTHVDASLAPDTATPLPELESLATIAAGEPTAPATNSVTDFFDGLLSDSNKTSNAQKLLKSGAAAISRIVLSIGLIILLGIAAAAVASRLAGFGALATGAAVATTSGVGLLGWAIRAGWKRRATKRCHRSDS
ncbi:hypothetical protein [Amycolatopsis sp. NPDC051716]|uniref:hypothetical protein n=1 Tax=Amycolatopsis sp. NPDC051716 TaxID=3155804 RepID=UPI00343D49D3